MARTDEQLVADYCDSHREEAANELVKRHLPMVRRLVYSMVLNDAIADDLTQDVLLRSIRGLKRFRRDAKFSTWITRIAINTTHTHLGRKVRHEEFVDPQSVEPSYDVSPEHAAIGHELDAQIRESLEQLTPKLRAAIVLTSIQGVSSAEAAEIEDCSVSTMHWRVHEARKQLRKYLKEYLTECEGK